MAEKLKNKILSSDHGGYSDNDSQDNRNTLDHDQLDLPLEKLSLGPRKKLLVLGLGGLLCHRVYRYGISNIPRSRRVDASFKTLEKKDKPLYLKDLKKLWNKDSRARLPMGKYSKSNTLLIDNDPYKALLNPPNTAIFPTEYKVDHITDSYLGPEGELRLYLGRLAGAADVTAYVKEHPFGQPAINASHSDWSYYSRTPNVVIEINYTEAVGEAKVRDPALLNGAPIEDIQPAMQCLQQKSISYTPRDSEAFVD
ncbi:uncharacterized protein LOC126796847 [Argentina anserina]|uniref:uncharacterized protein LOC126796847 n=1 Tax=Argentina anserina TaxID=57926 RepID=UPI0021768FF1|nr:uncharacterized protein LOC126796847 [Potentilla anserina]